MEQPSRAPETALTLLLLGEPADSLGDVCFIDEDEGASLGKRLEHKSRKSEGDEEWKMTHLFWHFMGLELVHTDGQ